MPVVGRTILSSTLILSSLTLTHADTISFNRDVRPIFINKCTKCHGGAKADGDLSLIYREEVLGKGKSGKTIIVPGHPEKSELYRRIITDDIDDKMPLQVGDHADEPLSKAQSEIIRKWIAQGAQWEEHWAYIPQKIKLLAHSNTRTGPPARWTNGSSIKWKKRDSNTQQPQNNNGSVALAWILPDSLHPQRT
ncbi:c-type cytochrome domain-containing protein [Rubritalea tangerina]|uniref:c-type cytochrome domain-containing protein n=1 Tax=Rubritalea tangerina TaxID=430798 RepID=UPI00360872FF